MEFWGGGCVPYVNIQSIMQNFAKYLNIKSQRLKLCHNGPLECKETDILWNLIQNLEVSQKKIQQHDALEENLRE